MSFSTQSLGIAWITALNRAIEFVDLSINRWRELKAEELDIPMAPPELMQFLDFYSGFMPSWVITYDDLAQYFVVPEDEFSIQVGLLILDELRFIRNTMQQLPPVIFEEPSTPDPSPDPDTTECERLIAAIENLKPGLTEAQVRQIAVEALQPVAAEILQQGNFIRVELGEARRDGKRIVGALFPYDDQTAEVRQSVFQGFFAIWNFPKEFPVSLVQKFNQNGEPLNPEKKTINNLMDLIEWVVVAFEEILGEWGTRIEFVTSKTEEPLLDDEGNPILDAEGNPQYKTVEEKQAVNFPNIAELLSEITPLIYQSYRNTEKCLEMSSKALIESGSAKTVATRNFYHLKTIEQHMGIITKQETKKIPMLFNVGAKNMLGFSKAATTDIEIVKWGGEIDQQEIMRELLFAAKIIKGVYWQPLPANPETASARFKEIVTEQVNLDEKLTEKTIENERESYRSIERAFTDKPGIGDTTDYWGGDLNQSVEIRQIINNPQDEPEE